MTCREFAEFLMDYLSGEASDEARRCFDEHLAECPDCVAYLQTYRETIRLGKAAFACDEDALPEDVPADLVAAILAAKRRA